MLLEYRTHFQKPPFGFSLRDTSEKTVPRMQVRYPSNSQAPHSPTPHRVSCSTEANMFVSPKNRDSISIPAFMRALGPILMKTLFTGTPSLSREYCITLSTYPSSSLSIPGINLPRSLNSFSKKQKWFQPLVKHSVNSVKVSYGSRMPHRMKKS